MRGGTLEGCFMNPHPNPLPVLGEGDDFAVDLRPFDAAKHRRLHWVKQLLFERSEFIFAPMKARSAG
jgi:hypothetical protein